MVGPTDISAIVQRIVDRFDPGKDHFVREPWRGDATEQSDIDLLVVAEIDLPPRERFAAIRRLLADYPAAFDVYLKTPEEYRRQRSVVNQVAYFAEKYGRVVHERSSSGGGAAVVAEGEGGLGDGRDSVVARRQPAGEHLLSLPTERGEAPEGDSDVARY